MPVPTLFSQLSTTAASNDPASSEARTTADDYFRQIHSFLRQLYEGATNGQVAFPATQNPSSNANTLDDYEEGTFTPTDGSGAGLSFSSNTGRYVKVGKVVHFWLTVTYPVTASGANALIAGLPFTSHSALGQAVSVGYTSTANLSRALVGANGTTVTPYNGTAQATNANLSGASFNIGGSYEASA